LDIVELGDGSGGGNAAFFTQGTHTGSGLTQLGVTELTRRTKTLGQILVSDQD
jgi:hypothetical protein